MTRQPRYQLSLVRGDEVLLEVTHELEGGICAEYIAACGRVARGEATRVDVAGVPEETLAKWRLGI